MLSGFTIVSLNSGEEDSRSDGSTERSPEAINTTSFCANKKCTQKTNNPISMFFILFITYF